MSAKGGPGPQSPESPAAGAVSEVSGVDSLVSKPSLVGSNSQSVFNFYKPPKESRMSWLARQKNFENVTLAVISLNAIWIGVDTDLNTADSISSAEPVFIIAENLFCIYFTGEVVIRFMAFKRKRDCMKDGWFKFDLFLVLSMILETWAIPLAVRGSGGLPINLGILRLLRLLRLTRMVRLMRSVPELLTLVKGMAAATRSVGSTMVLLIVFLYVFGIIFTTQMDAYGELGGYQPECPDPRAYPGGSCEDRLAEVKANFQTAYGSMSRSMFTLFVGGTLLDDFFNVAQDLQDGFPMLLWALMIFVLLSAFTVLNMLIGVLCEVVSETAKNEKEKGVENEVRLRLTQVFAEIDVDGSGKISNTEFGLMQENLEVMESLDLMGIEPKHLFSMADSIFEMDDEELQNLIKEEVEKAEREGTKTGPISIAKFDTTKELDFDEFLEIVLRLRPERGASVVDIADLRKGMRKKMRRVESQLDFLGVSLHDLEHDICGGGGGLSGVSKSKSVTYTSPGALGSVALGGASPSSATNATKGSGGLKRAATTGSAMPPAEGSLALAPLQPNTPGKETQLRSAPAYSASSPEKTLESSPELGQRPQPPPHPLGMRSPSPERERPPSGISDKAWKVYELWQAEKQRSGLLEKELLRVLEECALLDLQWNMHHYGGPGVLS